MKVNLENQPSLIYSALRRAHSIYDDPHPYIDEAQEEVEHYVHENAQMWGMENPPSIFATALQDISSRLELWELKQNHLIYLGHKMGVSNYSMAKITGLSQPTIARRIRAFQENHSYSSDLIDQHIANSLRDEADRIEKGLK